MINFLTIVQLSLVWMCFQLCGFGKCALWSLCGNIFRKCLAGCSLRTPTAHPQTANGLFTDRLILPFSYCGNKWVVQTVKTVVRPSHDRNLKNISSQIQLTSSSVGRTWCAWCTMRESHIHYQPEDFGMDFIFLCITLLWCQSWIFITSFIDPTEIIRNCWFAAKEKLKNYF